MSCLSECIAKVLFGARLSKRTSTVLFTQTRHEPKSLLFEATKYLFDYHGFVPFVGPAISYENLSFEESFEGIKTADVIDNKLGYALSFGWDIRPNRIQSWTLRTNLRWYPNLFLAVEPDSKLAFDNLEFNFIQLIVYPKRAFL
jgi:outer membrane protein W